MKQVNRSPKIMNDSDRLEITITQSAKLRENFIKFAEMNGFTFETKEVNEPPYFRWIMLKDGNQVTNVQRTKTACLSEYINS